MELKVIELPSSKYKFVYEPGKEWDYKVFRLDEDVTVQVRNNALDDLFSAFVSRYEGEK